MDYRDEMEANRKNWNDRVPIHFRKNNLYDVEAFKEGALSFCAGEHLDLKDIDGKTLLHLQCHFGLDTMSWSRLGAVATGVDFSEKAISTAETLRDELGLDTKFICSNIYDLPDILDEKFDIVFTSVGVLGWLPDLHGWAKVIANCLKPDGILYVKDAHPLANIFESEDDTIEGLKITYSYSSDQADRFDESVSYTSNSKEGDISHTTTYQWNHSIADIFNALSNAGLCVFKFEEGFEGYYKKFSSMYLNERGFWQLTDSLHGKIPLTFTLFARLHK